MQSFPYRRRSLLVLATLSLAPIAARAASSIDRATQGPAIDGFDAVAYFSAAKPLPGKSEFNTSWRGAIWWFASDENRRAFEAEPERYAPQYGGYCAYAMSGGGLAAGDPKRWKIVDGRLYLNNNLLAQKLWERDVPGRVKDADGHWPRKRAELEAKP